MFSNTYPNTSGRQITFRYREDDNTFCAKLAQHRQFVTDLVAFICDNWEKLVFNHGRCDLETLKDEFATVNWAITTGFDFTIDTCDAEIYTQLEEFKMLGELIKTIPDPDPDPDCTF